MRSIQEQSQKLIEFLIKNNGWHTSKKLGNYLGVSERQIRNYVKYINDGDNQFITSSNRGYTIKKDNRSQVENKNSPSNLEMRPKDRQRIILRELLIRNNINIYSAAKKLAVSEATIYNDLDSIKKTVENYDLRLFTKNGVLYLDGNETDKRRYINHYLNINYSDFSTEDNLFLTINPTSNKLINEVSRILDRNKIFATDFALKTIALHLVIMIERIKDGFTINNSIIELNKSSKTNLIDATEQIGELIEDVYKIKVNSHEKVQLLIVIDNNTSLLNYATINTSNYLEYIPRDTINISNYLLTTARERFMLDRFSDDFVIKFYIHIDNMLNRHQNSYKVKNPLTDSFKVNYPLVYDISVFMAHKLVREYNILINEAEITFIAFHLGTQFANLSYSKSIAQAAFITNSYYNYHIQTIYLLNKQFQGQLEIKQVCSSSEVNQLNLESFDLIISDDNNFNECDHVSIGQFVNQQDIEKIKTGIDRINNEHKHKKTIEYLNYFFEADFLHFGKLSDADNIIDHLVTSAANKGLCSNGLKKDIIAREKLSSTQYNLVAIPHSISSHVNKSFIYVYSPEEEIIWGKGKVQLIFLIAIMQKDIFYFNHFFDELVNVLNSPLNILELKDCRTEILFLQKILDLIKRK